MCSHRGYALMRDGMSGTQGYLISTGIFSQCSPCPPPLSAGISLVAVARPTGITSKKQAYRELYSGMDQPRNSNVTPTTPSQGRNLSFETAAISCGPGFRLEHGSNAHPTALAHVPYKRMANEKADYGTGSRNPTTAFQCSETQSCCRP